MACSQSTRNKYDVKLLLRNTDAFVRTNLNIKEQRNEAERRRSWTRGQTTYVFWRCRKINRWRLSEELQKLQELKINCHYECLDLNNKTNIWGLREGKKLKKKIVTKGWLRFLTENGYVPDDRCLIAFVRNERRFLIILDGTHPK